VFNNKQYTFPWNVYIGDTMQGIKNFSEARRISNPLIITGPNVYKIPRVKLVVNELIDTYGGAVYTEAGPEPTTLDVECAWVTYKSGNYDSIIAIGGGSRLDLAKAARVFGDLSPVYWFDDGYVHKHKSETPIICVPTTAGSGSEVSRGAIITDEYSSRKRLIAGPGVFADYAILDYTLTMGSGTECTCTSGIDALSHAIESYSSTGVDPYSTALAARAAKMIISSLPNLIDRAGPEDVHRYNMLVASSMAGMTFGKGLGLVHSIAHGVGGTYPIPHGIICGMALPIVMDYNMFRGGGADLLSTGEVYELLAASKFWEIAKKYLLEVNPDRVVHNILLDHCHKTNPVPVTVADIHEIIHRINMSNLLMM